MVSRNYFIDFHFFHRPPTLAPGKGNVSARERAKRNRKVKMPAITRKGDVESGHDCHFPPTPATGGSPDVFVIGNENWVLRYDHLSNIHYGYVLGGLWPSISRMPCAWPAWPRWVGQAIRKTHRTRSQPHIGLALYKKPSNWHYCQSTLDGTETLSHSEICHTTTNVGGSYSLWSILKIHRLFRV